MNNLNTKRFSLAGCLLVCVLLVLNGCMLTTPSPEADTAVVPAETSEITTEKVPSPASETVYVADESGESEGTLLSPRILLEEARSLACTGAIQYTDGDMDGARANLDAAVMNLQLLDLPEDMQSIAFFQPYLPDRCGAVDLDKVYSGLMASKPRGGLSGRDEDIRLPAGQFGQSDSDFIEMEILRIMENLGEEDIKPEELEIFVKEVERFIAYFSTSRKDWFERSYYRMLKYVDTVSVIMLEKRMPMELAYLAFVESGYMYRATSRAQARGIWQFIRGTGKMYGLKIGRRVDERLDPIKSTRAAREYLLDLISIYGSSSFLLAMASYNAGEGRVQRCLRKVDDPFEDRSFWKIRDCLHRETREYIPRIIAAAVLAENPSRFGLNLKPREQVFSELDVVICPRQVKLSSVAKSAGITLKELRELNPDLPSGRHWTPVNNTHLWVPEGRSAAVKTALATMSSPPPAPVGSGEYHTVRSGDSLYKIGRRNKIPYKRLASWNNISYPYKIKPGMKIYLSPPGSATAKTSSKRASGSVETCSDSLVYIVKKGNYLAGIGSLFGVTARDIMRQNNLKRGTIFPGQRLTVCPVSPIEIITHKVVRNETLHKIAVKYGVSIEDIRFSNGLRKNYMLKAGQSLTVYRRT